MLPGLERLDRLGLWSMERRRLRVASKRYIKTWGACIRWLVTVFFPGLGTLKPEGIDFSWEGGNFKGNLRGNFFIQRVYAMSCQKEWQTWNALSVRVAKLDLTFFKCNWTFNWRQVISKGYGKMMRLFWRLSNAWLNAFFLGCTDYVSSHFLPLQEGCPHKVCQQQVSASSCRSGTETYMLWGVIHLQRCQLELVLLFYSKSTVCDSPWWGFSAPGYHSGTHHSKPSASPSPRPHLHQSTLGALRMRV